MLHHTVIKPMQENIEELNAHICWDHPIYTHS